MKRYIVNVLLAIDVLVSALLAGKPGETLSGRAGSALLQKKFRGRLFAPPIDLLMWACRAYPTPRGHCIAAVRGDMLRAQAVIVDQGKA